MNTQLMTHLQQSRRTPAQWALAANRAMTLEIGPGPRELHVTEGRLWLTRAGTAQRGSEDIWLLPGDALAMVSGSEWVIEADGESRFQLLVPPCEGATAWLSRVISAWSGRRRGGAASALPAPG